MKKLGTIDVCGTDWPVFEATADEMVKLNSPGAAGMCSHVDCRIYLSSDCKRDRKETLLHEYMHALLNSSGALYGLLTSLGTPFIGKKSDAVEESFIRVLTPHFLKQFGAPKIKRCPS